MIIDTGKLLHQPMIDYWTLELENYQEQCHRMQTRFERAEGLSKSDRRRGDELIEQVQALFMDGFGIEWSAMQLRIFKSLIDSILPRIYGTEWEEVKTRVMNQRGMKRLHQETLVNMGRRNGKTWVVSGGTAAVYLVVPGITIACFSVGKRQSTMFMNSAVEKMKLAFQKGTHVNENGYNLIQKNQETIVYEHPSGDKQVLGCYPGSVKVSFLFSIPPSFFFGVKSKNDFPDRCVGYNCVSLFTL